MTMIDPEQLGPQDFDECFAGEPDEPDATGDLARGRRRRRGTTVGAAGGITAVAVATVLGLGLSAGTPQVAIPASTLTPVPTSPAAASPTPRSSVELQPTHGRLPMRPGPSAGPPNTPLDTTPALPYSKAKGYSDRDGHVLGTDLSTTPFSATTKNTYDLVQQHLDPDGKHLGPYEKEALTGGGANGGVEVGQKLSWTVKGQSGEGMLLVAVTRAAPGKYPVSKGDVQYGLCSGSFADASCRAETVDGRTVWIDRHSDGGFVVDVLQADGELAGAWVDPVFANNTDVPLKNMGVSLAAVLDLLADPDLDVVG